MKKLALTVFLSLSISAMATASAHYQFSLSNKEESSSQYRQDRYPHCQEKCALSSSNWYQCMDHCLSGE